MQTVKRKDKTDPHLYDVYGKEYEAQVCGHRLMVEIDPIKPPGIIAMTDETIAKEQLGQAFGTILSIGPDCWTELGGREVRVKGQGTEEVIPTGKPWGEVGDKVYFQRNAGARVWDPQKAAFREDIMFLNDKDIFAVLKPIEEATDAGKARLRSV